jgi:hypothetical protein
MVWKVEYVKQGDLPDGSRKVVHLESRPIPKARAGVRASIVVLKRRNGRGAKGSRKVDV